MSETKIIISQFNSHGSLQALVEEVEGAIYFYLDGPKDCIPYGEDPETWLPTRSVWIANTNPISESSQIDDGFFEMKWKQGQDCPIPNEYVNHSHPPINAKPDKFDILWILHGDAAVLYYDGDLVAYIPANATVMWKGNRGYTRNLAINEYFGMHKLSNNPEFHNFLNYQRKYWNDIRSKNNWKVLQSMILECYEQYFGKKIE